MFNISRRSTPGLRPRFAGTGSSGLIHSHSLSVRLDGYRLVFLSVLAMRRRVVYVHINSVNHELASKGNPILKRLLRY